MNPEDHRLWAPKGKSHILSFRVRVEDAGDEIKMRTRWGLKRLSRDRFLASYEPVINP